MRDIRFKPCPFCGSKDVSLWSKWGKYGWFAYAECDVCKAQTRCFRAHSEPYGDDMDEYDIACDEAIEAWNRREEEWNGDH